MTEVKKLKREIKALKKEKEGLTENNTYLEGMVALWRDKFKNADELLRRGFFRYKRVMVTDAYDRDIGFAEIEGGTIAVCLNWDKEGQDLKIAHMTVEASPEYLDCD